MSSARQGPPSITRARSDPPSPPIAAPPRTLLASSASRFDLRQWYALMRKLTVAGFTEWHAVSYQEITSGTLPSYMILLRYIVSAAVCPAFLARLLTMPGNGFILEDDALRFVAQLYLLLRREFEYMPAITVEQFTRRSGGFANAKCKLLLDVLALFRRREREIVVNSHHHDDHVAAAHHRGTPGYAAFAVLNRSTRRPQTVFADPCKALHGELTCARSVHIRCTRDSVSSLASRQQTAPLRSCTSQAAPPVAESLNDHDRRHARGGHAVASLIHSSSCVSDEPPPPPPPFPKGPLGVADCSSASRVTSTRSSSAASHSSRGRFHEVQQAMADRYAAAQQRLALAHRRLNDTQRQ